MKVFIKNIKRLYGVHSQEVRKLAGKQMAELPFIENAWLAVEDGLIADFGSMEDYLGIEDWRDLEIIDAEDRFVIPGFCDSHTHTVFAQSRADEFVDRILGLSYEDIAKRGGGILNSAAKLAVMTEQELYDAAFERLNLLMSQGTVAIEIKSGYGLDAENELKMLRVIQRLKENHRLQIKRTFLALHALPLEYKGRAEDYVRLMIEEVLPVVAREGLADYVDAFCEEGYFNVEQMNALIDAAQRFGIPAKLHVNQFTILGAVKAACERNAVSVDHLEELNEEDIAALLKSDTMPVALPACSFFLRIPYTPARRIVEAGLPFALASDFNPGSSPTGNMQFVGSLACIQMRMLPEEVINASTINGAFALNLEKELGSIALGKRASFIITKPMKSISELYYYFADAGIEQVFVDGKKEN
jgi:imidazolonepropionase